MCCRDAAWRMDTCEATWTYQNLRRHPNLDVVFWNLSCPASLSGVSPPPKNKPNQFNKIYQHVGYLIPDAMLLSQSDLCQCFSLDVLKHLATCRPLLVLKQSCTAAEGLQPVSRKDLLATARHKHRVKTSQSYARVNIYLAVSLENPINWWPPAVTKRWVEAACVAAPMPVPATKV